MNKKGAMTIGQLPTLVITLVLVAALFVSGYLILAGLGDSSTNAGVQTAVGNLTLTFDNVISYSPTWGIIIGVAILLGIVLFGFQFARQRGAF